jgi:hypothetical protein
MKIMPLTKEGNISNKNNHVERARALPIAKLEARNHLGIWY